MNIGKQKAGITAGFFIKFIFTTCWLLTVWLGCSAQKKVAVLQQSWLGAVQQVRLSQRWGVMADIQYRTVNHWVTGNNFVLSRLGATWYGPGQLQVSGGYGYVYTFGQNRLPARNEHRLWQQVQWGSNGHKGRLLNRLRLEERWREQPGLNAVKISPYQFQWRASTQMQFVYPLQRKKPQGIATSLLLAEEALFNMGKAVQINTFDQNRLSAGFQFQLGSHQVQATYMRIFQQMAAGDQYRRIHCARVFYTHTLDLRHKG